MRLHIILLILLLFAHAASSWSSYTVEKPWTYASWRCASCADVYGVITCESKSVQVTNWPYVYYVSCDCDEDGCSSCPVCGRTTRSFSMSSLGYMRGAWDINGFENALDELELDVFSGKTSSTFTSDYENYSLVVNNLNSAYDYRKNAYNYADTCKNSSSYSAHNKLVNQGYMCSYSIDMTFNDYRAIMAPGGTRASYPCTDSEPSNPAGSYCKSYYVHWQNAVSRAFTALSFSFSRADYKIESQARPVWNRMHDSGICDDDYDWDIGDACSDTESAFSIIDAGTREGTYGQYHIAKDYLEGLRNDVWNYPPPLENYSRAMKLLWQDESGVIPLFTKLKNDGDTALDEAETIYGGFISEANSYRSEVDSKYSEMESEKLSMIHETVAVQQISEESIGMISERFSTFSESKSEAEDLLSDAQYIYGRTTEDSYLKTATRNAYDAKNTYAELADSADALLDDAETVVEQQREQTLTVLNQAKTVVDRNPGDRTISSIYNQAKNLFDRGDAASALGDKFDYYVRAEAYAWQLLEEQHIVTSEAEELLLQVEDLVRRAEIDEINVATEEALLDNLEDEMDSRDISGDLRRIMTSILEKADLKYGYLLDIRGELLTNISRSEACGADLRAIMDGVEAGIISGTTIDYMNGIGRLRTLESEYEEISDELSLCENSIIANSLIISQSLNVGRVKIDEAVNAKLLLLISNPTYYSGDDVTLTIPLKADIHLLYSDISDGEENVANVLVDGNDLLLTLNRIGPYWTRSIRFEKDAVLAHTTSLDQNAVGVGNGQARVEETRTFSLGADDVYLDLSLGEVVSATIDGKSADSMFDSGEHTLSITYISDDAYSLNRSDIDAAKIGLNTQLSYKISIIPSMDMDSLPLTVDIEYGDVSGISISSISGASITSEECETGYCEIELSGLEEDEETLISVSYMILNTDSSDASVPGLPDSEYCIEGVDKKCDPLPFSINQTIAMINSVAESGDYATAIELREKLKDDISRWLSEQQSLADDYQNILALLQDEKAEIEHALSVAGSANGSLVNDMKERQSDIDSVFSDAEGAETLSEAVDALESISLKWKENTIKLFQDDSWNEYNSMKKRLFDAGVTTIPSEFLDVENNINALSASGNLEDAVKLMLSLDTAGSVVEDAEAEVSSEAEDLRIGFIDVKETITSILETYREQQDAAKGTPWESIFTFDSSGVESAIDEIEDMFGKEDNRLIKKKMELLDKKKEKITGILEQLKEDGEIMLETVRGSFEGRRNSLPQDVISSLENGLETMAGFIAAENYISALKAGKVMINQLENYGDEGEGINLLLLAGAIIAVLAAVGVYYYKYKKGGEGGIALPEISIFKKQEKQYKRLEKAEQ